MTDNALPVEAKITFQVYGNSLQQLFENAAYDLLKILINPEEVGETLREKIVFEAADTSLLFHEWITTLLRLASQQRILYKKSRFLTFDAEQKGPGKVRADVTGELIDPQRHSFRINPASLRCDEVKLLNNSKTIEAQVFLVSSQITLAK